MSLIGALPYLLIIPHCSVADAIFESISGFTTIGAARIQTVILRIFAVYLILSAFCGLGYWICGMTVFDALCHMFTTVSTGGFSTRLESIASFDSPWVERICIVFMLLGGTSFLLLPLLLQGHCREVFRNTELRAYLLIATIGTVLIVANLLYRSEFPGFAETVRTGMFQVVSILTTTGYATSDFDAWAPMDETVLLVAMVIGGSSGSTAGGIKVVRLIVGLKVCHNNLINAFRTGLVRPVTLNHRPIASSVGQQISGYLILIALVVLIGALIVAVLEPNMSFKGTLSAMFACLFNIGPGFGEVGPTRNYGDLHDYTKYFLSLLMLTGRLELYVILVLFMPSFWRRIF